MTRLLPTLLFLVLIPTLSCTKKSDEDLIRQVITSAVQGADERRAGMVVENATDDFKGPRGTDLRECRRILVGYFMQKGWLRVFQQRLEIHVEGDNATAQLEAVLARGKKVEKVEDVLPTNASVMIFDLKLRRTSDGWKITNAEYKRKRF